MVVGIHKIFGKHYLKSIDLNDGWCELERKENDGVISMCADFIFNIEWIQEDDL